MAQSTQPLYFYCQKVLPAVIDDSLSYYEVLCKLREKTNELIGTVNEDGSTLESVVSKLNEVKGLLDDVADGKYADLYLGQLEAYINNNLINYVARLAYYVFPGLDYDGGRKVWRYSLRIPASWKWLKFSWIWDEDRHVWHIGLEY